VNLNVAPCVDILFNLRNTIVNTPASGTETDTVIRHPDAFVRGERDVAVGIKHLPATAPLERDQYLVLGVNELARRSGTTRSDASTGTTSRLVSR
jgi:beta-N-acetylhexosaminidase